MIMKGNSDMKAKSPRHLHAAAISYGALPAIPIIATRTPELAAFQPTRRRNFRQPARKPIPQSSIDHVCGSGITANSLL